MVLRGQLLAQVDRQMAPGERGGIFILMLSNPVYSKPFRRARQEVTGATLRREGGLVWRKRGLREGNKGFTIDSKQSGDAVTHIDYDSLANPAVD